MNTILPQETATTKKDSKKMRNPISYHKIPNEKRVALLALRQPEYSAQTHALPQNLAALYFTKTDSGRQSITPPQSTVFLQNKSSPITLTSQWQSLFHLVYLILPVII